MAKETGRIDLPFSQRREDRRAHLSALGEYDIATGLV
jgi:hypothetical protein